MLKTQNKKLVTNGKNSKLSETNPFYKMKTKKTIIQNHTSLKKAAAIFVILLRIHIYLYIYIIEYIIHRAKKTNADYDTRKNWQGKYDIGTNL